MHWSSFRGDIPKVKKKNVNSEELSFQWVIEVQDKTLSSVSLQKTHPTTVTMKTFGLLLDRAWIWLDFPDFKLDYIKEAYRSDVCFAGRGPLTGDFHDDWTRIEYA